MHTISVSAVYATREQQHLFEAEVARGTNALELVQQSGLLEHCVDVSTDNLAALSLGIYSQKVEHDHLLEEGDRVEIYRPLTADPKEVRRQLAKMGKTMGKSLEKA